MYEVCLSHFIGLQLVCFLLLASLSLPLTLLALLAGFCLGYGKEQQQDESER